jgi:hypothetical protein
MCHIIGFNWLQVLRLLPGDTVWNHLRKVLGHSEMSKIIVHVMNRVQLVIDCNVFLDDLLLIHERPYHLAASKCAEDRASEV